MNTFCNNCPHRKIPKSIKDKYNNLVSLTFIESPTNDPNVVYCFIKYREIPWNNFINELKKRKMLTKDEIKQLEMIKILDGE